MKPKIRHWEIAYHGRNACGLAVFTCYSRGLGQFATDAANLRNARRDAREYFNRKGAGK
jgi:hypothetical protein